MTNSPRSDSEPQGSSAFELYDPRLRRWIWDKGWTSLRDVQERAARPILGGQRDVIVASATASGKTEAAVLPALTRIAAHAAPGLRLLAISPLKALINDQFERLRNICAVVDLPVHRWHGDVGASSKKQVVSGEGGVLLITPESLEALFVIRGSRVPQIVANLQYVLVDELHAFPGTDRGVQLQSLMHRVELAVGRRVPRIALSATLGDFGMAAEFLRAGGGKEVEIIRSDSTGRDVALQVRGYVRSPPSADPRARTPDANDESEEPLDAAEEAIVGDLWRLLRGGRHIAFCNRRTDVEQYCEWLRRRSEALHLPSEFWPHHGSLAKDLREDAEKALKDAARPATVVATSTLELGIDVGDVETIAQIGPPSRVSAIRQRLGRSGRMAGATSTLRIFVAEFEITPKTAPQDTLRTSLVQSIAVVRLLAQHWNEPPEPAALHLSTLVQQVLSMIAQHGGISAQQAWRTLCQAGPFRSVDAQLFGSVLRSLGQHDLIVQTHDGLLVLGLAGEKLVNHYDFYAAFASPEEYRIVHRGRTLGTLPSQTPLLEGLHIVFAARRWRVLSVDVDRKIAEVSPSPGGRPPSFGGNGPWIHDRVRQEMRLAYMDTDVPQYLDARGRQLLVEGREWFHRLHLDLASSVVAGASTLLFPWIGDRAQTTLMLQLVAQGMRAEVDGVAISVEAGPDATHSALQGLVESGPADPVALAASVMNIEFGKHHRWLHRELLNRDYASSQLDTVGAHAAASEMLTHARE